MLYQNNQLVHIDPMSTDHVQKYTYMEYVLIELMKQLNKLNEHVHIQIEYQCDFQCFH